MKDLICHFDEMTPNDSFNYIFKEIYKKLIANFPEYDFEHWQPEMRHALTSPGSGNHFQIINPDNKKTIVMSFADRGMDILSNAFGWEEYTVTQYLGGLGINLTKEQIKDNLNVEYIPFQYPLDRPINYEYVDECSLEYDLNNKIRKAFFIGRVYNRRETLLNSLSKHPLVDIYDLSHGLSFKDYLKKLTQYRLSLSLNGNGEFALRDVESMGLRIPTIRSELLTQFHNPLIPGVHYIKGSEPCIDASCTYRSLNDKDLSEQFVEAIEESIDNFDLLKTVSDNGYHYYNNYTGVEYMVDLFIKLINLDTLR